MRISRFWIYLPLTFGIASLISIFAWDSFIFAVILGGLGIVSSYFALDKYPDEENINFTGAALSYSCIMIVIGILLDKFFD